MSQATVAGELERADALIAQGRYEAAVPLLERIAFSDPDDAEVWARLTTALISCGEYERAAITSYAFEALAPSPAAYLMRSRALLHVDPQEALSPAMSAQAADPQNWQVHAQVARCLIAGPDGAGRGLQAAEKAVAMAPQQAEAVVVLALAQRRHNRIAEAESTAGKALSLDPTNAEARDLLQGLALLKPDAARSGRHQHAASVGRRLAVTILVLVLVAAVAIPLVLVVAGENAVYAGAIALAAVMIVLAVVVRRRPVT